MLPKSPRTIKQQQQHRSQGRQQQGQVDAELDAHPPGWKPGLQHRQLGLRNFSNCCITHSNYFLKIWCSKGTKTRRMCSNENVQIEILQPHHTWNSRGSLFQQIILNLSLPFSPVSIWMAKTHPCGKDRSL